VGAEDTGRKAIGLKRFRRVSNHEEKGIDIERKKSKNALQPNIPSLRRGRGESTKRIHKEDSGSEITCQRGVKIERENRVRNQIMRKKPSIGSC